MLTGTRRVVWLDVETTGKHAATARIVQLGLRILNPGKETADWESLFNPCLPIPAEATEIHGISDADVLEAPIFSAHAASIARGLDPETVIAGFNVRYDTKVLAAEFERCGISWEPGPIIDPLRLWQIFEPRTLADAVRRWLAREPTESHDAMGDVIDAQAVTHAILEARPEAPREAYALSLFCFPPNLDAIDKSAKFVWLNGVPSVNFGKHAGKPVADVPRKYFSEYMLREDFPADTKAVVRRILEGDPLTRS